MTNFEEPDGSYGTVVQGNFIGTDITGTKALGDDIGVDIEGASSALIGNDGGPGIPGGNVISGNLAAGIIINAASANVGGGTSLRGRPTTSLRATRSARRPTASRRSATPATGC